MKPSVVCLLVITCILGAQSRAEITQTADEIDSTDNGEFELQKINHSKTPSIHSYEDCRGGDDHSVKCVSAPLVSQDPLQQLSELQQLRQLSGSKSADEENVAKSRIKRAKKGKKGKKDKKGGKGEERGRKKNKPNKELPEMEVNEEEAEQTQPSLEEDEEEHNEPVMNEAKGRKKGNKGRKEKEDMGRDETGFQELPGEVEEEEMEYIPPEEEMVSPDLEEEYYGEENPEEEMEYIPPEEEMVSPDLEEEYFQEVNPEYEEDYGGRGEGFDDYGEEEMIPPEEPPSTGDYEEPPLPPPDVGPQQAEEVPELPPPPVELQPPEEYPGEEDLEVNDLTGGEEQQPGQVTNPSESQMPEETWNQAPPQSDTGAEPPEVQPLILNPEVVPPEPVAPGIITLDSGDSQPSSYDYQNPWESAPEAVPPQPDVEQPMSYSNIQTPWIQGPEIAEQPEGISQHPDNIIPHAEVSGPEALPIPEMGYPNHLQLDGQMPFVQPEPSIIVDNSMFRSNNNGMLTQENMEPAESFLHEPAWTEEDYHLANEGEHDYYQSHGEMDDYAQLKEASDRNELLQKLDELEDEITYLQYDEEAHQYDDHDIMSISKMKSESGLDYGDEYEESVEKEVNASGNILCLTFTKTLIVVGSLLPVFLHVM